ncbi:MAG: hypothetical protein ACOC2D_15880, partial [Spirochaetota bacterium]
LYQMQNRRSRIIWFVAIAIAFLFIVDPFRLFESNTIPQMRVNREIEQQMVEHLSSAPDADRFVLDSFDAHDLVLLGETGYVKQQLEFLADLIPRLDAAGIRHLGFQYANRSDQDRIDELLTRASFDEDLAEEVLFDHMVIMGYEEHRAVFRAAWQVNRDKDEGDQPFRIIGLSHDIDYTLIEEQDDVEDADVLRRLFADGVPDEVMAATVMERIVEPGHRGLVYTKFEHAFTRFVQPQYTQRMSEQGFANQKRMGNILADRLGNRVMTTLFHMPIRDTRSRAGYGYPVGGLMEKAVAKLPEGPASIGFDVSASPYAEAPVTSDTITEGMDEELTFERFTDGYLVIGPIASYEPVTPIAGFITESNIARAREEFPGPNPGEVTAAEMNEYIVGTASSLERIFEEFE